MRLNPETVLFTLFMAAIGALPPLAIDMGLPALGAIGHSLGTSPATAGLTLSLFMAGFGIGPLVAGPLSDRLGRKIPLAGGLLLFALGGVLAAAAPGIVTLLAARVVQGLGGGTGATLIYAIIRDLFEGRAAHRRIANVAVVSTTAPMVAPSIGAIVLPLLGWRAIYALPAVLAIALFALMLVVLPESLPPSGRRRGQVLPQLLEDVWLLLRTPAYVLSNAVNALSFAALFSYVSASPLVTMGTFGMTRPHYALLFACTSLCIITGAFLNGRIATRIRIPEQLLGIAVALTLLVGLVLVALTLSGTLTLAALVPLLLLANLFFGLGAASAAHSALEPMRRVAGTASGLLTTVQMGFGSLASLLASALFPALGTLAMTGCMAGFAGLSAICCVLLRRNGLRVLAGQGSLP
ncbi:Bcr/CflA family efflux MFS transporter [Acetobacteraceae bacterium KSS8]|uniref:Bcr/CflA family efflux transporter n=1 Tax=Endosaccharibacter trunci TaxID=2812733 RepID=A0ABT1WBZ3_9PROT|nr:Bcr/CflA family efflux MFS transporter [Acetobacteraceae bacterium KSS8]